jgi:K+/H+ antiporter YhaU regulatory subunit KhtT
MAQSLDFSALLSDPAFAEEFKKGYARGEAIAQTVANTPTQPQVQGIEMAASPKDMQKQMYALLQKSMGQQQQQVEQLKAEAEKEKQRQEQMGVLGKIDLRPFAQALQQYGSTTVAVPKEAPEDRTEILRKLQAAVSQAEQGLTKEQVALMRNLMDDKKAAQADISLRNAEVRETKAVVDPLLKISSGGSDLLQNLGQIESVVSKKDIPVQEFRQIVTKFGKSMGEVGAQTENDRTAYFDPTILDRLNILTNKFGLGGTIPNNDPSVQAILAQMKYNREQASAAIARKAQSIADTYGSPGSVLQYQFNEGKPGNAAYKQAIKLSQDMLMPRKAEAAPAKKAKVTPKDVSGMSKEQLKKYLGE